MRPTKNRYYCISCHRTKMLFDTKRKALNFIRYNKDDFEKDGNIAPIRAYYCKTCLGWHLTSKAAHKPEWLISLQYATERCEMTLCGWQNIEALANECKSLIKEIKGRLEEGNYDRILDGLLRRVQQVLSVITTVKEDLRLIVIKFADIDSYLQCDMFASAKGCLREVRSVFGRFTDLGIDGLASLRSEIQAVIDSYARKIEDRMPAL